MINRWTTHVKNINLVLAKIRRLIKSIIIRRKERRGRKPKHNVINYVTLIVLKEFDKRSLRGAEVRLSNLVCNERVDHSVIAYWENKPEVARYLQYVVSEAGKLLDKLLTPLFTFVDATKFTSWNIKEVEIHVANRVAQGTVYPIGTSFLTNTVRDPVRECLPPGNKLLYADAWYDDNKALGVMFSKGYIPVVCPNKNRWKGHYRKRARKIYNQPVHRLGYRQRGRGESTFGSWTNEFGDRFKACTEEAMRTKIVARILVYQIKLLIRAEFVLLITIVRHALKMCYIL